MYTIREVDANDKVERRKHGETPENWGELKKDMGSSDQLGPLVICCMEWYATQSF